MITDGRRDSLQKNVHSIYLQDITRRACAHSIASNVGVSILSKEDYFRLGTSLANDTRDFYSVQLRETEVKQNNVRPKFSRYRSRGEDIID